MDNGQLEMTLTHACGVPLPNREQRHRHRARWWFERMRQCVDRAIDWQPAPPPPPQPVFPKAKATWAAAPSAEQHLAA